MATAHLKAGIHHPNAADLYVFGSQLLAEGAQTDGPLPTGLPELVRALIASKILRRRKVRRAILIHLLKAKAETEFEGSDDSETESDEETGDEGGGEDREIVRALIASKMLRRRRVRRALLTHLLREKEEAVA